MASKYPIGYPGYPVAWWVDPSQHVITDEQRERLFDWVRSLGLEPDRLGPVAGVIEFAGRFELHVDEILTDEHGYDRFDPLVADALLKQRRIVPVEEGNWPERYEVRS